jgi:hypothetical protein
LSAKFKRLKRKGQSPVAAGVETTRVIINVASFHILSNAPISTKLREEFIHAIPDETKVPPWSLLESLLYLTAVILEDEMHVSKSLTKRHWLEKLH